MAMNDRKTRVLLVEDNPGDARLIREMLKETGGDGFEIDWVSELGEGLERLGAGRVDLVLLDLGLPDSRGIETFFTAYAHSPHVPFVLMTGLDDETLALTAVRQGAQDYLVKGETDANMLFRAIRYATERKAAERALEAERQKLYTVLNSLPAFVYLGGADYQIRFANRRFQEIFGEPGNRPCYQVMAGRSAPCETCQPLEVLRTKVPQQFEWTNPNDARTYEVYNYPFCAGDSSPLFLTLGVDISERRRFQEQLIERTHDLGERLKELHCLYNLASLLEKPDTPLDEIIQRVLELIIPAWQFPEIACARIRFEGRTFSTANFRESPWGQNSDILVHEDCRGSVEVFYLKEMPTLDEGPFLKEERRLLEVIAKTLGSFIERKAANEALKKSEAGLAEAQRIAHLGYWDWDIWADTVFCSDEIYHIYGRKPEAASPAYEEFMRYAHPEDRQRLAEALHEALTETKPYGLDYRIVRPDGSVRIIHDEGEITFDATGQPVRLLGTMQDITERKQAEEKLRESQQKLRYLATQLLTAQERERERISRDLHDDLGQSLLTLKLGLQSVGRALPQELAAIKEDLGSEISLIDEITDNVRRLAKDLRPSILEDLGLSVALKHLFNNFRQHNNVELSLEMEDVEEFFSPDGQLLIYRVFQEALTNIARHAFASRVAISIKRGESGIVFIILDNGRGFATNAISAGEDQARGLGLSAMEERIYMLGGSFNIWSQKGQGTRITFTIPTHR
jgi:signal transduction histidine kinase/CheY-like chemotaxis protein